MWHALGCSLKQRYRLILASAVEQQLAERCQRGCPARIGGHRFAQECFSALAIAECLSNATEQAQCFRIVGMLFDDRLEPVVRATKIARLQQRANMPHGVENGGR